jgi:putative chitinase
MKFDHPAFLSSYSAVYGQLNDSQSSGLESLLANIELDQDVADLRWAAYMLATVKLECADTFQPITEYGGQSYFNKYDPGTSIGKSLGNTEPGDGYLFRGRGYVQLTGRTNYGNMNGKLALSGDDDLVLHPEVALQPDVAYRIMSYGMRHGTFTGKKLGDYINDAGCDYQQARRIINGLNRADDIAGYAASFESSLKNSSIA